MPNHVGHLLLAQPPHFSGCFSSMDFAGKRNNIAGFASNSNVENIRGRCIFISPLR
jgi:hypothetical protein